MKRQRGRGRKPGGGGSSGGGSNHGNHGNRSLESNGPEVKIRGTAAQIYEKYAQYARDSQQGGDRVKYENYLQHAEHYFRLMAATMPRDRVYQPVGEGGMPFQQQQDQGGNEGGQQPMEAAPGIESADALKVMDDQNGEDGDDFENDDGEETREGGDTGAGAQESQQDDRQGRRRRRGRRRPNDNDRNAPQSGASVGGEAEPQQPRSALDSLARRQGAIAGS